MDFWNKLFGKNPSPEDIAAYLQENEAKKKLARKEEAIKKAHNKAHRGNQGAIGELTKEALQEFEKRQGE